MRTLFTLILLVTVAHDECATPAIQTQRQEIVNLCEARGGVPILSTMGTYLERCDFPPVAGALQVEKP